MATVAKDAVFVKSDALSGEEVSVRGPSDIGGVDGQLTHVVDALATIGFQATNFGKAVTIARKMLDSRRAMMETTEGEEDRQGGGGDVANVLSSRFKIYLGLTANLLGTGVRESILFLVKHRLVDYVVITGGGVEHDIRRAVAPYTIDAYGTTTTSVDQGAEAHVGSSSVLRDGHFGNVRYPKYDSRFVSVMKNALRKIIVEQTQERLKCAAAPIPDAYFDVCSWSTGPSEVWRRVGLHLPELIGQTAAETTVTYWAAKHSIPLFSPSFSDGDVTEILNEMRREDPEMILKIDLVQDIHAINKSAMGAEQTGMIILGGGVAKHHVCNANLMRNGANLSIFINNAQEYDGSDAGARPDEAVSWGKIKIDGEAVKIYSEISLVFPLLVARTFVPFVQQELSLESRR